MLRERCAGCWREGGVMVTCPYCNTEAELVSGDIIYPHRRDLASLRFYLCRPCDAYVGCHKGSTRPLGVMADAELRQARQAAHRAFDPLWKDASDKKMTRLAAYGWLSERLGIEHSDCHIGMFDVERCQRVVAVCESFRLGKAA